MPEPRQSPVMAIADPADRLFWAILEQTARDLSDRDPEIAAEAADWMQTAAAPILAEFGIGAAALSEGIEFRRRRRYTTLEAADLFDATETSPGTRRGRLAGRRPVWRGE